MLVARVIDDEVHDDLDAARVQRRDHLVEILERAEERVDVLVVADVVAVVILRALVEGREPHDVHAELGEMVDPLQDAAQVADAVPSESWNDRG